MEQNAVALAQGVWNIAPGSMSAVFLVTGGERALLVDTGAGDTDIMASLRGVSDLPVTIVITHGHMDHLGGAGLFDNLYAHPEDMLSIKKENPELTCDFFTVKEGYKFDLGGRILEVIELPGHTPGSIALLDRSGRMIFTGDTISDRPVFFVEGDSDIDKYINSLDKLLSMRDEIDMIFCCHGTSVQDITAVEKLKRAAEEFATGKLKPKLLDEPVKAELYINAEGAGFLRPTGI